MLDIDSLKMERQDEAVRTCCSCYRRRYQFSMGVGSRLLVPLFACLLLAVTVTAIPDQIELEETITEERTTNGSLVVDLVEDGNLRSKYTQNDLSQISFQFLSEQPRGFAVDRNGAVVTTGRIDRDVMCPNMETCQVSFEIITQPAKYISIFKITITILDVNDNGPDFGRVAYVTSMVESAAVGSSLMVPAARDPDSPALGVVRYVLRNTNLFKLKEDAVVSSAVSNELVITLNGSLDHEVKRQHTFQVVAYDGGYPPKYASMDVVVNVVDANDNRPVFNRPSYEVTIPENIDEQTSIIQVQAEDSDVGVNGEIEYRFNQQTLTQVGDLFAISPTTGEVTVTGQIDYEVKRVYYLGVQALDKGPDPMPVDVIITVRVVDENDHAPDVTVNTLRGSGVDQADLQEDAPIGTFVARIAVKDDDAGTNAHFECSMVDNHFELQKIGSNYQVLTSDHLDREKQAEYSLAFICKDSGQPQQIAIKHIRVRVLDVNDNVPVFIHSSYTFETDETSHGGVILAKVNASDADEGRNSRLMYTLSDNVRNEFEVDASSGVLKSKRPLDREEKDMYSFTVYASDSGTNKVLSGSASVIVLIRDINDSPPIFSQNIYTFSVLENRPREAEVGIVTAQDNDGPPHNAFTISIASRSNLDNAFKVNKNTGRITTTKRLDREHQDQYILVLRAVDTGNPALSGSCTVTVYVMDVNDNAPVFLFPSESNDTIRIPNDIPTGYIISQIRIKDDDLGQSAIVKYKIAAGNTHNLFEVDEKLGTISITRSIHDVENETFTLAVTATDNGSPARSTTRSLHIAVHKATTTFRASGVGSTFSDGILTNLTIVVSVACLSGVLIVALALSIAIVCYKQRRNRAVRAYKHKCRMDALKVLTARETLMTSSSEGSSSCEKGQDMGSESDSFDLKKPASKMPCNGLSGGHAIYVQMMNKPTKVDISLEKSRQWLETIEPPKEDKPVDLQPAPRPSPQAAAPLILSTGDWPLQHPTTPRKATASAPRREGDTESVGSGEGSHTDSGRGGSEEGEGPPSPTRRPHSPTPHTSTHNYDLAPVIPPRGTAHHTQAAPARPLANKSIPAIMDTIHRRAFYPELTRGRSEGPGCHRTESARVGSPPPQGQTELESRSTPHTPNCPRAVAGGEENPTGESYLNNYPWNNHHGNHHHGHHINHVHKPHCPANRSDLSQPQKTAPYKDYSVGDIDDVLRSMSQQGHHHHSNGDDDGSSTTSGSYVVDPQELILEIDNLFMKDIIV